jgi:recombinational DNA repair protein (RecF pathway)
MIEWRCERCGRCIGLFDPLPARARITCKRCKHINERGAPLDKPPPERVKLRQPEVAPRGPSLQADGPFDAERG